MSDIRSTPTGSEPDGPLLATDEEPPRSPRDLGRWATGVGRLDTGQHALNVDGRRVTGPQQGFGRMWERVFAADIGDAVTPEHAVAEWRAHFGSFWPRGNHFLGSVGDLTPGEVAPIHVAAGPGVQLATGVLVLYADERSFTFMTPQGHMFAGWITFGARQSDAGTTVLEVSIMIRANDPVWEVAMPLMLRKEATLWTVTLENVAGHLGAAPVEVSERTELVDRGRLWRNWTNVWHNAGIRSVVWTAAAPVRIVRRRARARAGRPEHPAS